MRLHDCEYDPSNGRWTAKDPIDFSGGSANLFEYVGSDPINYVDPSGLLRWPSLDDIGNAFAGFGDTITFGLTRVVRRSAGWDDVVNRCSGWYLGGTVVGLLFPMGMARLAARAERLLQEASAAERAATTLAGSEAPVNVLPSSGRPIHVTPDGVALPPEPMYDIPVGTWRTRTGQGVMARWLAENSASACVSILLLRLGGPGQTIATITWMEAKPIIVLARAPQTQDSHDEKTLQRASVA